MTPGSHHLPPLALWGGGGHALVVAEAVLALNGRIEGFYDDDPTAALGNGIGRGTIPRLGTLAEGEKAGSRPLILAIGNLARRRRMLEKWLGSGTVPVVLHPSAVVSPSAKIGAGAFVGPRAVVHTLATVGPHAIVNTGAIIEHECQIGENAHLAPGSIVAGRASVGPDTLVGVGAVLLPGVRVGAACVVGAGAIVRHDVPDGETVVGVPARAIERPIQVP